MATDMDIDMDIDVGVTADEFVAPEIDILPDAHISNNRKAETPILNAPEDSTASELAPNKVHIRGLDNLTTKDIRAFASEHYPDYSVESVEWIDDTSANLVYENEAIALEALRALVVADIGDISDIPLLQEIDAKSLSSHPNASLLVRLAVVGDKKKPRARESSRFYLLNPEYDPAERRRRGQGNGGRKYRDRDDGGYRSQRYDDREQQNRMRKAENAGFDASLYDDDESALAQRTARNRADSSSDSDSKRRFVQTGRATGKELFPERPSQNGSGRLRDRSASPLREVSQERYTHRQSAFTRKPSIAASENRLKAQMIKAGLAKAGPKELFPQKGGTSLRGSGVFDVANETADLFANKMPVPFIDGSADRRLLGPKTTNDKWDNITGFSIKGASKASAGPAFNIKGAASGSQVKELFPAHFGDNAGKELFSGTLEGRGRRRQKAEDLFH